jgi:hypothetical protein
VGVSYRPGLGKAGIVARALLLAPGRDAVDHVGPGHYPTHALDKLLVDLHGILFQVLHGKFLPPE